MHFLWIKYTTGYTKKYFKFFSLKDAAHKKFTVLPIKTILIWMSVNVYKHITALKNYHHISLQVRDYASRNASIRILRGNGVVIRLETNIWGDDGYKAYRILLFIYVEADTVFQRILLWTCM